MKKSLTIFTIYLSVLSLFLFFSCASENTGEDPATYGFNEAYEPIVDSVLATMSLDEKVFMVHGDGMFASGGIERLGIPALTYADGPTGIREELGYRSWEPLGWTTDSVTFFPTGTALAATWNKDLALRYGQAIGNESRARNKDVLLAPGVNIIRTPLCGRNFEYFSEDPVLASAMTVGYVKGVQMQDVAACVKHFALNNQEYMRGWINVETDERTLREIYLPVYKAAVIDAQAYALMGAYNKFRGDYLCENDYLQNQVAKGEWGFKGIIISDWGATHSTVKAALNGLDVEMGGGWGRRSHHMSTLADSVKAGLVPESIVDDKVRRILRVMYNCKTADSTRHPGSMNTPENSKLAYDVASEAIVLLKNDKNHLPLQKEKIEKIAVIGMMADMINAKGGFTAGVKARYEITPLKGLQEKVGKDIELSFAPGYKEDFVVVDTGGFWPFRYPNPAPNDTLIAEAVELAKNADYVLLFAGNPRSVETEASDRLTLSLPFGQDSLIQAITAVNQNTIIVFVAGAACDVRIAEKASSTLVYAWYNGSENGRALADMLFGDVNPSGKLPFTIPEKLGDIGAHALNAYPGKHGTVEYKEGILNGYRWLDTKEIEPAYCFGYGLSYTDFELSGVKTNKTTYRSGETIEIYAKVSNTGAVSGKETIQVYTSKPESHVERAAKELKAFDKVSVDPGASKKTRLSIPVEDLAYFDAEKMQWVVEPGEYKILVGNSSRNINAELTITVE